MKTRPCVFCDVGIAEESLMPQHFGYRIGPGPEDIVILTARDVPVFTCLSCGDQWTDFRGEEIRTAAVEVYKREHGIP